MNFNRLHKLSSVLEIISQTMCVRMMKNDAQIRICNWNLNKAKQQASFHPVVRWNYRTHRQRISGLTRHANAKWKQLVANSKVDTAFLSIPFGLTDDITEIICLFIWNKRERINVVWDTLNVLHKERKKKKRPKEKWENAAAGCNLLHISFACRATSQWIS